MNQENKISQSLLELSDAIEQLALILAQQKYTENKEAEDQFHLLVNKLKATTNELKHNQVPSSNNSIANKFQKGYLENWLLDKEISLGNRIDNLHVNDKLYNVADFLADHYTLLKDFYEQLKRAQNLKKDFKTQTSNQSIKYIRKWSNLLHRNKMIDSFYFLDESTIDVDIASIHDATYFINGFWLEIFLRRELALILRQNLNKIENFDILAQAEIVKPNQKSTEIDLLLMINEKVFWFESKSGNIGKTYFNRFTEHKKLFNLPSEQSLLLVPQMQLNQAEAVFNKTGMNMLYATNLQNQLQKTLFPK